MITHAIGLYCISAEGIALISSQTMLLPCLFVFVCVFLERKIVSGPLLFASQYTANVQKTTDTYSAAVGVY